MSHLEETYERGNALTGVPTGFTDLDELLSGLQRATLNIVGARPSMGKTAFALNIAAHVAQQAMQPVLFFSLEMGHLELTQRILAAEAQVDLKKIRTGDLTQADWSKIGRALHNLDCPLYLDDNAQVSVMEIRAKARRMRSRHGGLALVVIDYLQLMTGRTTAENRQLEVSEISRNLKILARELDVPILALSQLSRNLESRSDKRPMLADLRESGALEQDADVVMFIYRDEVYNEDSPERGAAEVLVAKHRNGPIGSRRLVYRNQFTRFDNAARVL
jgi:replicative DNA helicase